MQIHQFRYAADNLAYLICGEKKAVAIDPGAVRDIFSFLQSGDLKLQTVVNTHSHPDHTVGNNAILNQTRADYLSPADLLAGAELTLEGERIAVYHTPGHTDDSLVFQVGNTLITGDTLFNGKAGKCFTGDLGRFLESIKFLMEFPDDTRLYAGHDYVQEYMETARRIEPQNAVAIDAYLWRYSPDEVVSTLAEEYQVNPCLRFNTEALITVLKDRNLPVDTEYARWQAVMSIV